jgi:hypothetical protein
MFVYSHDVGRMQDGVVGSFALGSEQLQAMLCDTVPVIAAYVEPLPAGLIGDEL